MRGRFRFPALAVSALALVGIGSVAFAAETRVWNYTVNGTSPTSGTQRPTSGVNKLELFEDKGVYTFRIRGGTAPLCYSTEVPANVEQDATTLTITPTPRFDNCERIRLLVKKDGTGGVQQFLQGRKSNQVWVTDEDREYGLTAR